MPADVALLGPTDVRRLAEQFGVRPTKARGQNFMHDGNTVRRITRLAGVGPQDVVLEVGPGLGSLTLALLETGARVVAVEIDDTLAGALTGTVAQRAPGAAARLSVVTADALRLTTAELTAPSGPPDAGPPDAGPRDAGARDVGPRDAGARDVGPPDVGPRDGRLPGTAPPDRLPTALVANLPYNVAVPVLLTLLERLPSLQRGLVLVQAEVAERLACGPGERAYGVPSVKAAWYAQVCRAGGVPRSVFWPVPNVDSGLVALTRRDPPVTAATRDEVFACIDAAFAQRRKTLRGALAGWAGSTAEAERFLRAAGVDPRLRGEQLSVRQFADVAQARAVARVDAPADH